MNWLVIAKLVLRFIKWLHKPKVSSKVIEIEIGLGTCKTVSCISYSSATLISSKRRKCPQYIPRALQSGSKINTWQAPNESKNGHWLPVYLFAICGITYFSKRARPVRALQTCLHFFHRYFGVVLSIISIFQYILILKYLKWFLSLFW